jgi:hypothetical protein
LNCSHGSKKFGIPEASNRARRVEGFECEKRDYISSYKDSDEDSLRSGESQF